MFGKFSRQSIEVVSVLVVLVFYSGVHVVYTCVLWLIRK